MKHTFKIVGAIAAASLLAGCGAGTTAADEQSDSASPSPEERVELQISAAASLQNAFVPLIETFEAEHSNITVAPVNFDGSSTLVEQIVGGDRVDVFASADLANMDKLVEVEHAASNPVVFATNAITLAIPADNPANLTEFTQIENPDVSMAICAPEVPCGAATERLLAQEDTEINAVTLEQNVSAVTAKIASGEVDGGFVYQTDVLGSDGQILAIDTPSLDPNQYPVAVVEGAPNPEAAQAFVDFLTSSKAQEILAEFGFGAP